ncbi:hypothetical protein [Kineosporia succinea]|uniref:SPP1 family holin n=1 Tax=Kineosporia succinea TaxID=84632 RepID=A0ABT9NZ02_9ACTN|nr:hypothetical protein [Kineosporia succinea]MDP9825668.1 hypothetical protein [Kineosporia succinea]
MSAQITLGFGAFFAVIAIMRLTELLDGTKEPNVWSWLVCLVSFLTAGLAFWSGYETWKKEKREKRETELGQ